MRIFWMCTLLSLLILTGCKGQNRANESNDVADNVSADSRSPGNQADTQANMDVDELIVNDIKIGSGRPARTKDLITTDYQLWLYDTRAPDFKGRLLESSEKAGRPFYFILRGGRLPQWMGAAILGIKKGGIRQFIVPHALAVEAFGEKESLPESNAMVMQFKATEIRSY